jgi:hypothetical protein
MFALLTLAVTAALQTGDPAPHPVGRAVSPRLTFPDAILDDTSAYDGYRTRLYRDAAGNVVQRYEDRRADRVVFVWGDSENESLGFTARDPQGRPAPLACGRCTAQTESSRRGRALTFSYSSEKPLALGWFLLGTMRVERDFQYWELARRPFGATAYTVAEVDTLVRRIAALPAADRAPFLAALNARDLDALAARLRPTFRTTTAGGRWRLDVVQPTLDGRDTLALAITVDPRRVRAALDGDHVTLAPARADEAGVAFEVTIRTTTAPLTPLTRAELFTPAFLAWADREARTATPVVARRLERDLTSVELLASREKLFAGLPTYATYFGRDLLVSTLMMQGVWQPAVTEAVMGAVLRKLSAGGEVSHEESLGGQATREAAAEATRLLEQAAAARDDGARAARLRGEALTVVRRQRATREAYHMVDDEFQLPVLVARWLADSTVSVARQRAFLSARTPDGATHAALLVRELAFVAARTAPYAAAPSASTLVSFAPRDTGWGAASWRDSGAGYAGGRYPMDVNAIWAPAALADLGRILDALRRLGLPVDRLAADGARAVGDSTLVRYARDRAALDAAVATWRGAARWFAVTPDSATTARQVAARLAAMPAEERAAFAPMAAGPALPFLAVALDAQGRPLPVMNTDASTRLFLAHSDRSQAGLTSAAEDARDLATFATPYPRGLLVAGIGPVVANDAWAAPGIWGWFTRDPYHGPRVVWGREVSLFVLGAAARLRAQPDAPDAPAWRAALQAVRREAAASGFHAELWSYAVEGGRVVPRRYGSGGDLQLWSTTELAVQYALSRLGGGAPR